MTPCPRCGHALPRHTETATGYRCQAPVTSKRNSRISPTNTCRCKRRPITAGAVMHAALLIAATGLLDRTGAVWVLP